MQRPLKIQNIQSPETIAVIILKFEQDADGLANSADPDQTDYSFWSGSILLAQTCLSKNYDKMHSFTSDSELASSSLFFLSPPKILGTIKGLKETQITRNHFKYIEQMINLRKQCRAKWNVL